MRGPTTGMFLSDRFDMFTSQLAEQEALNGPSLEKAAARYIATSRSSTGSRAKSFQSQKIHSEGTSLVSTRRTWPLPTTDIEVLGRNTPYV